MDTSGLKIKELELVVRELAKALDGCISESHVLENKIAGMLRANIVVALSVIGLFITSSEARLYILPALTVFFGSIAGVILLLKATKPVEVPFPGASWADWSEGDSYRDEYGNNEEGMLKYMEAATSLKIQRIQQVTNDRADLLDRSLKIALGTIIVSVIAFGANALFVWLFTTPDSITTTWAGSLTLWVVKSLTAWGFG